jgi:DNA-binding GntR family transcriptional regulator
VSPEQDGRGVITEPTVSSLRQLHARSLEREAYDALCEHLLAGRLKPGDPLVEAQLSAEFGVSKTPIREALIRLQRDGLVEIVPYRGARVNTPTEEDIRDACELRKWIEVPIAQRLAEVRPPDLLAALPANITEAEEALARGDWVSYVTSVRRFSEFLLEADGNRYARDVLIRLRNVLALIANASGQNPDRPLRSIDEHRAIFDAIAAGDPDAAAAATEVHIESLELD